MIARHRVLWVALWLGMLIALPTLGQTLNDLTGRDVTADKLISVLAPKEPPPPETSAASRGLRSRRAGVQALPQGCRAWN